MSLFEAVRPAMHAAVRKVLQHHKLSEHGDSTVEADLIYAVLDNLGVGEAPLKSNTRSAMPSEVIEAALLLKRWATERNEAPGWHIAGIGEVGKDRVTVASVHAAARAVYAIQLLQAGSTRMADGRWGSIKTPSDEAMSYALGAMIELNNELSSLFHRNPTMPMGDWVYDGKAATEPAAPHEDMAYEDRGPEAAAAAKSAALAGSERPWRSWWVQAIPPEALGCTPRGREASSAAKRFADELFSRHLDAEWQAYWAALGPVVAEAARRGGTWPLEDRSLDTDAIRVDFDYLAPWPMPGATKPPAPPSTMLDRDQCLAVMREAGLGHLAFNEDNVAMLSRLCNKAVEAAFRRPAKGG